MFGIESALLDFVTKVYDAIGWPGVVFLMAVESASIPFPSELIMPLAGWLLIEEKGGSPWLVLLAGFYGALGNLLGSWAAYFVSLTWGRPLLHKYGKYVLLTREELDKGEEWFRKYGEWAVFFLPVIAGSADIYQRSGGHRPDEPVEVQPLYLRRFFPLERGPGLWRVLVGRKLGRSAVGNAPIRHTHPSGPGWRRSLVFPTAHQGHSPPEPGGCGLEPIRLCRHLL